MTARLVGVGNALIDLALDVPHLPARGGDVRGRSRGLHAGGAANVLLAARRQGLPAAYAGAHGTGPLGDRVRALLAAEGVEVLLAPYPDLDTGVDGAHAALDGDDLAEAGLAAAATDRRTVGDTWARQVEYASAIALVESAAENSMLLRLTARRQPSLASSGAANNFSACVFAMPFRPLFVSQSAYFAPASTPTRT